MEVNYSKEQFDLLDERFSFMRDVKTLTGIVTVVLIALFLGGIYLISYGLALLGLIVAIVMFLPSVLSFFSFIMLNKFFNVLKKHKAKIISIDCKAWIQEDDDHFWHKVTDYADNEYYYFTKEKDKRISSGETLHVIMYDSIFNLSIAFDPILEPEKEENIDEVEPSNITTEVAEISE